MGGKISRPPQKNRKEVKNMKYTKYTTLKDTLTISEYHAFLKECHYNGYTFEIYYNFLTEKIDIVCVNLRLWQNDVSLKEYRRNCKGIKLIQLVLYYFGLCINNDYDCDDDFGCFEVDDIEI